MKKLTDYYVLITENIVDEVIEYFSIPRKRDELIGWSLIFWYDDKNSWSVQWSKAYTKTRLKWSKMKRFIENSPTREKYLSAQQQSKGYKKCWLEEKQRRELLGQNFDNLLQEKKDLEFSNFKLKNRVERLSTERKTLVGMAKENGITNTQDLTDWVNSILESNKIKSAKIENLINDFKEYSKLSMQIKESRDKYCRQVKEVKKEYRNKYYEETQELKKTIEASNITQEFLKQEIKRLKLRNRILTIGFILSASFYLIASIF